MRVPITLDLHLPNFNYPGVGPDQVFDKLVDIATTAERSGFSSVSLMDHLHQIPPVGPPENWMFDGNTMLSALAARTSTLSLGTLVGGVTYRNPSLLAKITTTLDIVSGGRAWLGLGAAWFEDEHNAYGFEFPSLKIRFERLEEALQITRAMFTQEQASFSGTYYKVDNAYNNPKPIRGDIPILIGGSGERKTLRMVAQYADGCNLFGDPAQAKHLIGVLEAHCERLGRDPSQITKTAMGVIIIAPTQEAATTKLEGLKALGIPEWRLQSAIIGDPDTVGERVSAYAEVGIEGYTLSMPEVHDLEMLDLVGRTLSPIFAPAGAG
jgi:F420-dependent oxidoreductase-like protein